MLAQTLSPSQVIVVDDGSHDHTMAVLSGYAPQVTAIRIDNSGSIVARNVGLRLATAPLVAFCDSDDLWQPNFLARMAALWQAEPRTRVAYANFRIVRDGVWSAGTKFDEAPPGFWSDLRPLGNDAAVFDQPVVERLVRFQPFFPSACVADRVAMLGVGGWDEGVGRTVGDDFGTVLRLGELHPFGVLSAPLVDIRKHPGNFSASVRAMNLGDAGILEYALASRPSLQPHAELIRDSIARRRADAFASAFADRDFPAVREIYQKLPPGAIHSRMRLKYFLARLSQLIVSVLPKFRSQGSFAKACRQRNEA